MKKITLKGIALGLVFSLLISCKPKEEEATAVDKVQIKNEIQAMENKMAEMYNDRTIENEEYYAKDATSFGANTPAMVGRFAIKKSINEDLATYPKGHRITFITIDVFPSVDGHQVVEVGNYKVRDSMDVIRASGNFLSLFEKRDGKYTCVRDMAASDLPREDNK